MFFGKKKKKEEPARQQARQSAKEQLPEMDATIRPGGVFMIQLLMKEPCDMPSGERMEEVLSKYLGEVESFGSRDVAASFAAKDYMAQFKDGQVPVSLMISSCDEFQAEKIDEFKRSQMWDCMADRDRILSGCGYQVLATDMLGGGLPSQVRANMLMDYLEALLELYPQCEAVYNLNSGKLILADEIRRKEITGINRFIRFAVNVRFFNIQGADEHVVDTLGMSLLYIEDLQYHFHSMDPNWVVGHACNMASYLLGNDNPMKDGDTIDGIRDGQLAQDIQWKCHYEEALVQPNRAVIDICMDEFAAGTRNR